MGNIPKARRGEAPISAAKWNQLRDGVLRMIRGGRGIQVQKHGDAISIINTQAHIIPKSGGEAGFAKVSSVHGDYLTCADYDPVANSTGGVLFVAKPYLLRQTPFDGSTVSYLDGSTFSYTYSTSTPAYARTATNASSDTESQVITPAYISGEVIRTISGNTGVVTSSSSSITLEDLNTAGRQWARSP